MAWYTPSGAPANQSSLTSASMRAEFALIQTNISNKLPTYTGNGSKAIFVNSGGTALEAVTAATARTNLGLVIGTNVQAWGADLDALDALSSTGIAVRTASNTWAQRTITAPAAGISIADGNGVSGNPTLSLANDLLALEGLSSTGIAVRTTTDTWAQRTITGTSAEITVTNGNGVSGNPTLSLPTALTFTGKTVTGGTFSSPVINTGTVGTSLNPTSDDGAALGSASASWSDLFLASGALLNFANGNAVVTHSSGILTVSTGDLRVTTAGTNSASAVTVGGTQTLTSKTLTSPTINGGALSGTFSGAHTKSGILTLTASGSASNSALKLVSTEPSIGWNNTNAAADNKQWDMEIASLTLVGRVINDAGSVAANWITVTRSGATITSVNFPNGALQAGGVAVPTISSTSTLTNKTIALGSNTVSGTMAQFDTACTDGNFVYQSQALGTPASGTLTNCTGLPQAGTVGLTTADSPQFTGINLGHASDTTLARVSAGIISIEGEAVFTGAAKVKTANTTVTSATTGTTLTDDPHLAGFSLQAGTYLIDGRLTVDNESDTPDFKHTFQLVSGTVSDSQIHIESFESAPAASVSGAYSSSYAHAITGGIGRLLLMSGYIVVSAAAVIDFQWAQNVSSSDDAILLEGSYIKFTRIS